MTPLEHIDFLIITYWTSNIWSLWHISLQETHCHHISYSFWEAARDLLYALSHRQDSKYHNLWWISCGPVDGRENSPNCKCTCHAASTMSSKPLQLGALLPELCPAPPEKGNIYVIGWTRPETELPISRIRSALYRFEKLPWSESGIVFVAIFLNSVCIDWIIQHQ